MLALSTQQTYLVYAHRYVTYVTCDLSCVGASEATEAPCNDSAANCTGAQCGLVKCPARQAQHQRAAQHTDTRTGGATLRGVGSGEGVGDGRFALSALTDTSHSWPLRP